MKAKKIVSILAIFCIVLLGGICLTACGGGGNNKLTIFFDSNGGTNVAAIEYVDGDLTMPSDPTREDYLFGGWFEDNGTWDAEFDASKASDYVAKKNITLYAKWLKKVILVFVVDTEQIDDVYLDSLDIELPTPNKGENYTFVGWYLDSDLNIPYTTRTVVTPTNDNEVLLYPKWESNSSRSVYYDTGSINLPKTSDSVEPHKRLTLYQPKINFYEFCGWFYDSAFTKQAPLRLSYEEIDTNGLLLYGKFIEKEVNNIKVVGQIRTHYEYGENIDLGNAKILVTYKDSKYASEIIDITPDMIVGFSTQDNGQITTSFLEDVDKSYDFFDYVKFKIDTRMPQNNDLSFDIDSDKVFYTDRIIYYVNSDLESFTLSEENLTFDFGDQNSLSKKGLSVNWTNQKGESGIERIYDTQYSTFTKPNCYVSYIDTQTIGQSTLTLRYHFKKIEVNYTVNFDVDCGYLDESINAIILNSKQSLLDKDIDVYIRSKNGKIALYESLTRENIVNDIDTTTAGEKTAKIKFNGQEIDISYYVIDLDKISSFELQGFIEKNRHYIENGNNYEIVKITMDDGYTIDFNFERNPVFELGGNGPNAYLIGLFDTFTTGTKFISGYFYGKEISIKYVVVEMSYDGII